MMRSGNLRLVCALAVATVMLTASSSEASAGKQSSNTRATEVEFIITGTAPIGVKIAYGIGGAKYKGELRLPLHATQKLDKRALYADVNAQLQGAGNITCTIRIGNAVKTAHATGGYSVCTAQLNRDVNGGWG
jgi:hypothetical protein